MNTEVFNTTAHVFSMCLNIIFTHIFKVFYSNILNDSMIIL